MLFKKNKPPVVGSRIKNRAAFAHLRIVILMGDDGNKTKMILCVSAAPEINAEKRNNPTKTPESVTIGHQFLCLNVMREINLKLTRHIVSQRWFREGIPLSDIRYISAFIVVAAEL